MKNLGLNQRELQEMEETRKRLEATAVTEEDITEKMLLIIQKAYDCGTLMSLLCEKLGLQQHKTTHQQFVEAFTNLQKQRLEYEKDLQEMYISTTEAKKVIKRPRKTAVEKELEEWAEFPDVKPQDIGLASKGIVHNRADTIKN